MFPELIHKKAEYIYDDEVDTQVAQRELVSILAICLRNKVIAKKVLDEHPKSSTPTISYKR